MIRSGTIHTIHELASQGKSIREIARILGIARNTVRRYLRGKPEAVPRPKRESKLDSYKAQIRQWVLQDRLYNCEVMYPRLKAQGYTGSLSTLKALVHDLRPAKVGHHPIQRYETKPGEQMQFDWAELHYEHAGQDHKLYGFAAILSYSRMRFVTFVKRCDTPTMLRCMMDAFDYFGGVPRAVLTDRMKSVFLEMDGHTPKWNPQYSDFMASLGVSPRVCKAYKPQTKGKVEGSVSIIKHNFWPGIRFTDIDDLNEQARLWCDRLNQRVHRTTMRVPMDMWVEENLTPLPKDFAWERYGAEERKVSWDGFISYDGVYYGLPASPPVAGLVVLVREHERKLRVYHQGQLIVTLDKRPRSQEIVKHPEQFLSSKPTAPIKPAEKPLAHLVEPPNVAVRPLITHARTEAARFLSYEISASQDDTYQTKKKRSVNGEMRLRVPPDLLRKKCQKYQKHNKPIHRKELTNNTTYSIVAQYQSEFRGFAEYYQLANDLHWLNSLKWIMEQSLTKTLATKQQVTVKKVHKKLGTTWTVDGRSSKGLQVTVPREGKNPLVAKWGGIPLKRKLQAILNDQPPLIWPSRSELEKRLLADTCELCGSTDRVEVHHIRALKDLERKGRQEKPLWAKVMSARRRKTLVVCWPCHRNIHAGRPVMKSQT